MTKTFQKRPAETVAAGTGVAALVVALAAGNALAAAVALVGLVPAAVTLVVRHGGVRGCARLLWRGRA